VLSAPVNRYHWLIRKEEEEEEEEEEEVNHAADADANVAAATGIPNA